MKKLSVEFGGPVPYIKHPLLVFADPEDHGKALLVLVPDRARYPKPA